MLQLNKNKGSIIFGATNESLCKEFVDRMSSEFEMSMMGELNFFLGLQIKQTETGTMIHQQKYVKKLDMDRNKQRPTILL